MERRRNLCDAQQIISQILKRTRVDSIFSLYTVKHKLVCTRLCSTARQPSTSDQHEAGENLPVLLSNGNRTTHSSHRDSGFVLLV